VIGRRKTNVIKILGTLLAILVFASVAVGLPHQQAAAVVGPNVVTAGGAGVFPAGASFSGVELAGGTFGLGVQTDGAGGAVGDLELQLNGTSLIGLSQWITVSGWITAGTQNPDGSMTFNGTGTLDMGDGTAPVGGLALVANLSSAGLTVTIGSTAIPTLPKSDGWIAIE
jgi:hypothetical protein